MNITAKIIYGLLLSLALGSFALLPTAQAVSPPPDGGYPGGNTAEGQMPFLVSPPAASTRPLVSCRSGAIQPEHLTLRLVPEPCSPTPPTKLRLLAEARF